MQIWFISCAAHLHCHTNRLAYTYRHRFNSRMHPKSTNANTCASCLVFFIYFLQNRFCCPNVNDNTEIDNYDHSAWEVTLHLVCGSQTYEQRRITLGKNFMAKYLSVLSHFDMKKMSTFVTLLHAVFVVSFTELSFLHLTSSRFHMRISNQPKVDNLCKDKWVF